ncbi:GH32 C-terminal domain-containing protein [Leifsonia shinshuensis]
MFRSPQRPAALTQRRPGRFRGRIAVLVAAAAAGSLALAGLVPAAVPAAAATPSAPTTTSAPPAYHEPYRPQFHYSLPTGWIGDPNGLVYKDGLYYLFSYGTWRGAVSKDLVHWTNIDVKGPVPDPGASAFFSGSAVVDTGNTSGFGTAKNPAMVAIYTSVQAGTNVESQDIAYSTDDGRTWTRYAGDPVIDLHSVNFRDPKVFWYAPKHEWMMAVALSDQYKVAFYTSPDLKTWTPSGTFGPAGATTGVWEMPDLYQLPVDGDAKTQKWVLSVSVGSTGVQYFVGSFDGSTFVPDGPATYTPPAGTPLDTFDSGSYGDWTTTGTAFGSTPASGALPDQQPVTGYPGSHFVDSFTGGDAGTGTLTSPAFTIDKSRLNFLVGGGDNPYIAGAVPFGTLPQGTVFTDFSGSSYGPGWTTTGAFVGSGPSHETLGNQVSPGVLDTWGPDGDPGEGTITSPTFTVSSPYIDLQVAGGTHPMSQANPTAVNLVIGGKVVETATGNNSGSLAWTTWDTSAHQGQQAQLQVVDQNDGSTGWGHLMVGDIVFASEKAPVWDTQTSVDLVVDGQVVRSATGKNSESLDWASWNVADLQGKQASIRIVDNATGGWGHILADDFSLADEPALNQLQRADWIDYGADFYAENTWNDAPGGRRVNVAWMNDWAYAANVPTTPWQGAETFPRTESLQTIGGKVRLVQTPVPALANLRTGPVVTVRKQSVAGTKPLAVSGAELDVQARLTAGTASTFGLNVRTGGGQYTQIGYDTSTGELYVDRTHSGQTDFNAAFPGRATAPVALDAAGGIGLRILIDASSVEVFTADGTRVITEQIFPDAASTGVSAFATGGTAGIDSVQAWHLKSIWN